MVLSLLSQGTQLIFTTIGEKMKLFMFAIASLLAFNANATSLHPETFTEVASVEYFNMSPFLVQAEAGNISVNQTTGVVTISLLRRLCGAGDCTLQPVYNFSYEIKSVTYSCGSKMITAEQTSGIPGTTGTVVIADHRTRVCEDVRPFATDITQTISGRGRVIENHFGAETLHHK